MVEQNLWKKDMLSTHLGKQFVVNDNPRPTCLQRVLEAAKACKLVCLIAPAGYAKTQLMRKLYQQLQLELDEPLCVWLNLTILQENHEESFIHTMIKQYAELDKRDLRSVSTGDYSVGRKCYIFIDDHRHDQNVNWDAELNDFFAALRPQCHVILASRILPKFHFSDLVLTQQVKLFQAPELSFQFHEMTQLFSSDLPQRQLDLIFAKTQGWPYALYLCAELLKNHKTRLDLLQFSGEDYVLSHFFQMQVIHHLSADQYLFLRQFAYLHSASVELCNAALGRTDSKARLTELYHAGVFVEALDRNYREFKIHPLFAEFLQAFAPIQEATKILTRAAFWSIRHQYYKKAADYARLSAHPRVEHVVIHKTSEILVRNLGELPTMVNWIRDLKNEQAFHWNTLIYWLAWSLAFSYQWDESKKRIADLNLAIERDKILSDEQRDFYSGKLESIEIVLLTFQDHTEESLFRAQVWLSAQKQADHFDQAVVACAQFICAHVHGQDELAQQSIAYALNIIRDAQSPYGEVWVNLLYAFSLMDQGYYSRAKNILEKYFYQTLEEIGEHASILSTLAQLLSFIYYEQNQIDSAEKYVEIAMQHVAHQGLIGTAMYGIGAGMRLAASQHISLLDEFLDDVHDKIYAYPKRLKTWLTEQKIEILVGAGYLSDARILVQQLNLKFNEISAFSDSRFVIRLDRSYIQILIALAEENLELAQTKLLQIQQQLLQGTEVHKKLYLCAKLHLLQAFIAFQQHQYTKSIEAIKDSLKLAQQQGYIRLFIDLAYFSKAPLALLKQNAVVLEPAEMALFAQLEQQLNLENSVMHLAHLTAAFSKRELELLAMLESGLKYQQIADRLFISLSTVKWHINNIYSKLGVKNRSGALVAAREHNLI